MPGPKEVRKVVVPDTLGLDRLEEQISRMQVGNGEPSRSRSDAGMYHSSRIPNRFDSVRSSRAPTTERIAPDNHRRHRDNSQSLARKPVSESEPEPAPVKRRDQPWMLMKDTDVPLKRRNAVRGHAEPSASRSKAPDTTHGTSFGVKGYYYSESNQPQSRFPPIGPRPTFSRRPRQFYPNYTPPTVREDPNPNNLSVRIGKANRIWPPLSKKKSPPPPSCQNSRSRPEPALTFEQRRAIEQRGEFGNYRRPVPIQGRYNISHPIPYPDPPAHPSTYVAGNRRVEVPRTPRTPHRHLMLPVPAGRDLPKTPATPIMVRRLRASVVLEQRKESQKRILRAQRLIDAGKWGTARSMLEMEGLSREERQTINEYIQRKRDNEREQERRGVAPKSKAKHMFKKGCEVM